MRRLVAGILGVSLWLTAAPTEGAAQSETPVSATPLDSLRVVVERATAQADWGTVEAAIVQLRSAIATPAGRADQWLHYDLAYALHRRASGHIVEDQLRAARPLLEEAIRMSQRSQALGAGPTAVALEGAVTGQLAGAGGGLSPMRYGPRAFELLDRAVRDAPQDPRVALLNGITRFNAPRVFGGGPVKGEAELRRAVRLFDADRPDAPRPVWGRVDAHLWLGMALKALDRPGEARAQYQRVLALSPGHRWVTERLLPELGDPR
jgi:tetratricopeptide (TPR) repeat protein